MLLAREVLLHQHLDHHRHDDRARRAVRPVAPPHVQGEPDHGRRRPGVHDCRVRRGQPQEEDVRTERDAQARVQRAGHGGDVRDRQRAPPAQTDLREPEHDQDLRQRAPHGQIQGRYEEGERRPQQRRPERVLGPHGTGVLDEPVAPGLVVHEVDDGRETDGGDRQGDRPQTPPREGRTHGLVQRSPFGAGPADGLVHPYALMRMPSSVRSLPARFQVPAMRPLRRSPASSGTPPRGPVLKTDRNTAKLSETCVIPISPDRGRSSITRNSIGPSSASPSRRTRPGESPRGRGARDSSALSLARGPCCTRARWTRAPSSGPWSPVPGPRSVG